MNAFRIAVLLSAFAVSATFAEETNTLPTTITVDGITYSNVTWHAVTPATVSIFHQSGAASIPLEKLPPQLQERFGYDPQKAAEYRAQQSALAQQRMADAQSQQEEAHRQAVERQYEPAAIDLVSSNTYWNLLNEDQRHMVQSTGRQFRSFFDARTFDGWSDNKRATLERRSIDTLKGPRATDYYKAISTLAALHSTNALPALREMAFNLRAEDNRDRWMAVRAMGVIGDKSVVPEMIHLLYHRNLDTRWWAQISLVELTGQNFGKDWNAWGKWWNSQHGQPPFNPAIIRWWSGQAEPAELAHSFDESDRRYFQKLSNQQPE